MTIWAASPPHFGSGPSPWAAGRLRVVVAGARAAGLHAVLLLPARPTMIGSAAPDAAPTMVVRLLVRDKVSAPALTAAEPAAAAPAAAEVPAPQSVARGVERRSEVAAVPASAASAGLVKAAQPATPEVSPAPTPVPGLPPAPDYFAGRLDPGPRPLEDVNPLYPDEAKQQEGSVVLRLLINESGVVDNVAVVRSYPAGLFEASALEAFGKARFSPGRMLGVAVKSQITIEVLFTPINRGKVSGRSY